MDLDTFSERRQGLFDALNALWVEARDLPISELERRDARLNRGIDRLESTFYGQLTYAPTARRVSP